MSVLEIFSFVNFVNKTVHFPHHSWCEFVLGENGRISQCRLRIEFLTLYTISWTTIVVGYVENGKGVEAPRKNLDMVYW